MKWNRRTESLYIAAAAVGAVGIGALVAMLRPTGDATPDSLQTLWSERPTDLLLQAALLLGGSLSIRALLPEDSEETS